MTACLPASFPPSSVSFPPSSLTLFLIRSYYIPHTGLDLPASTSQEVLRVQAYATTPCQFKFFFFMNSLFLKGYTCVHLCSADRQRNERRVQENQSSFATQGSLFSVVLKRRRKGMTHK